MDILPGEIDLGEKLIQLREELHRLVEHMRILTREIKLNQTLWARLKDERHWTAIQASWLSMAFKVAMLGPSKKPSVPFLGMIRIEWHEGNEVYVATIIQGGGSEVCTFASTIEGACKAAVQKIYGDKR